MLTQFRWDTPGGPSTCTLIVPTGCDPGDVFREWWSGWSTWGPGPAWTVIGRYPADG